MRHIWLSTKFENNQQAYNGYRILLLRRYWCAMKIPIGQHSGIIDKYIYIARLFPDICIQFFASFRD